MLGSDKFMDFPEVSKKDWINQVERDLKGERFEQKLVTKTNEGFSILPFYTAEDTEDLQWIKSFDNQFSSQASATGPSPRKWTNVVDVSPGGEKEQNEEMLLALKNGADGCILELSGEEDFSALFKDISIESLEIWIKPANDPEIGLAAFFKWIGEKSIPAKGIRGGLMWDSLAVGFDQPIQLADQMNALFHVFERCKPYPYFKSVCLTTSVYHDAGATAVQEIAYGMGTLIEVMGGLTQRGCDQEDVFKELFLLTAVGSNYFMEIAKLKTFRVISTQLAHLYKVTLAPGDLHLFVKSSYWSKCKTDPYNNLLRNTTEAMSAITGGCNALWVEPHDRYSQRPAGFSKRMARNISSILKEEAYFDKVVDPAAGSYYVENLVNLLNDHAVQLLHRLEDEGGWGRAYAKNQIQQAIKATRNARFAKLAAGQKKLVGVQATPRIDWEATLHEYPEKDYQLKPFSQAFPFETDT